MDSYQSLETRFRRVTALQNAVAMLHWDKAAMMPEGGAEARAEQLAALNVTVHEMMTDPVLGDWLDEAEQSPPEDIWRRSNLREMRRLWIHKAAIDARLVEARTRAVSACEAEWRTARSENDFRRVAPYLDELLALTRETAASKAERLGCEPYEALLDSFEPGARIDGIERLFRDLGTFLPGFLDRVLSQQSGQEQGAMPDGPFPVRKQQKLATRLMAVFGFDFGRGRLDCSIHPFCGGVPDDVRITTRYNEDDFSQALMGILHETGHALYEMGLPVEWRYQPVGTARGMVMHESQSLLIEMQVCRSRAFLGYAAPLIRRELNGRGPGWDADSLYRRSTKVERGFIRVDADEVTYPFHVLLRYRLERAMIEGDLAVVDLPDAWNEGMESSLGIRPPDDLLGCLQDIHWYDGAWGYFPTYTMGALAAAQLFESALSDIPELWERIATGEIWSLVTWLQEHVHARGSVCSTNELLEAATGRPLGTDSFKRHLERRYAT